MATPLARPPRCAPRPSRRPHRLLVVLAAVIGLSVAPLPAAADPQTSEEVAELLAAHGHELEKVTERFNDARETLKAQQAAEKAATEALEKARAQVAAAQESVRGIARSAFTGDSLSSFHALLTSGSADEFVDRMSILQTVAGHQNQLLDRAAAAGVSAAQAQAQADAAAAEARATYDAVAAQQADLQKQIDEYQALFDRLSADERRAALAASAAAHAEHAERASRSERTAPEVAASGPIVADSQAAQIAVDTAMAQRGKPYVWAAAGPGSYDCSGLVQYAYAAAGIGLPHSSRMQSQMGQQVSRAELRPGDLVFFYSPVSHVGIYIGNGQMVHAPTFGDVVRVASVDSMGGYSHGTRIAG